MRSCSDFLLRFMLALLLFDVVICSRSSSSSSSESDSSESDEDASKPARLLSKEGLKKRLLRALSRVAKINERSRGYWIAKAIGRFAKMSEVEKKRLGGSIMHDRFRSGISNATKPLVTQFSKIQRFFKSFSKPRNNSANNTCTETILFDARKKWPACAPIINKVQDQGSCGSCWAVSAASQFSDRYCINRLRAGQSIDANSPSSHFSALDLMCTPNTLGCDSGNPVSGWEWIQNTGIVTGTDYTTNDGCKPYPFEPKSKANATTPMCVENCTNSAWKTKYTADRKFANETLTIGFSVNDTIIIEKLLSGEEDYHVQQIKNIVEEMEKEIKQNGPVVAYMDLYDDLNYYSSGVYKRTSNKQLGAHSVRLIGWGKQTCTDGTSQEFWVAFNSWNTDWGQNGLFYIAKGVNEVGIETLICGGTPKV